MTPLTYFKNLITHVKGLRDFEQMRKGQQAAMAICAEWEQAPSQLERDFQLQILRLCLESSSPAYQRAAFRHLQSFHNQLAARTWERTRNLTPQRSEKAYLQKGLLDLSRAEEGALLHMTLHALRLDDDRRLGEAFRKWSTTAKWKAIRANWYNVTQSKGNSNEHSF